MQKQRGDIRKLTLKNEQQENHIQELVSVSSCVFDSLKKNSLVKQWVLGRRKLTYNGAMVYQLFIIKENRLRNKQVKYLEARSCINHGEQLQALQVSHFRCLISVVFFQFAM